MKAVEALEAQMGASCCWSETEALGKAALALREPMDVPAALEDALALLESLEDVLAALCARMWIAFLDSKFQPSSRELGRVFGRVCGDPLQFYLHAMCLLPTHSVEGRSPIQLELQGIPFYHRAYKAQCDALKNFLEPAYLTSFCYGIIL